MTQGRLSELRTVAAASVIVAVVLGCGSGGCATAPRIPFRAERYHLEVRANPATHWIVGRSELNLVQSGQDPPPTRGPVAVELLLHPQLKITRITASGALVTQHYVDKTKREGDPEAFTPRRHVIVLDRPAPAVTLFVDYAGELFQDVAAGEKIGQIHNFTMRSHIGENGIYLADGYWYPEPAADEGAEPSLADFTLVADPVPGMELVAGAERDDERSDENGQTVWRSPYPLDGMVLVGGPHEIHRTDYHGTAISAHLKPSQAEHAEGLLSAVKRNLDRYEPLIGPYPAGEYAVVDNFFSSGFAFPTFTLLSSALIDMGERYRSRHGILDHEMLHCWWGNGIHVDPRDGNWCEALTSYATNYYGYVLDGNEDDARRTRRDWSHFLSRIEPKKDKPLGRFGRDDDVGRGIGYNKGAMVFHMLARKIGQDTFWSAMRRFTAEYTGAYAAWNDIRRLCEAESGQSLEPFFNQWVRRAGAPKIRVQRARFDSGDHSLLLDLAQDEPAFDLEIPIRITHGDGDLEVNVPLNVPAAEIAVPVDVIPLTVEVDPDYHLFRKVPLEMIVPTTAATRYGDAFTTVLPEGDVPEAFTLLQSIFGDSFKEEQRSTRKIGGLEQGELAERCALILGDAVRDPYVAAFLSAIEFPVRWFDGGFELDGVRYTDPGDAVLVTAAHPGVPGGGVTVIYANSSEAFPNPRHVTFYDRSVVIFQHGQPTVRMDFEKHDVVPVEKL